MKRIIAMVLIVAMLFATLSITVSAAKTEEFISEVALIYEDSVEDAKEAIAGTGWKLFEQDLNANADYMIDDGVYLIYKTTTDVEDAITDLRVMDMYGGYSSSNYDRQLQESRSQYMQMISNLRVAAAEFRTLYQAEDAMALLAYRQMNYYKDEKTTNGTETDQFMGDFFLNLPSDDQVVQVLFEGNSIVVSNLITLLAIGLSCEDAEDTLAARVAGNYEIKDTLTDEVYHEDAVTLHNQLVSIRSKLLRYDALKVEHNLEDEELTEEEFQFLSELAAIAAPLEEIKLGETSLADMIRGGTYTTQELYPVVASLTDGQKALIQLGMLETVLTFNAPSKPIEEMNSILDEVEEQMIGEDGVFIHIDVYEGIDRSVFDGAFAMTSAAERQQALTGETWDMGKAAASSGLLIASYVIAGLGAAAASFSLGIFAVALFYKFMGFITTAISSSALASISSVVWKSSAEVWMGIWGHVAYSFLIYAAAFALIAAGMASIALWYNYYNPDYTEIPNTMIDVRETDLGDKYIKYTAAKVFEDGKLSEKNADLNAYEGKEWNALYYTKDATAGHCLTPNFVFKDNDASVARRHQGVSMFGETDAFNLNSHVYNKDAKGAYLTVRYSNTKKAAAEAPDAVGSVFATGALYMVTVLAGAGIGTGAVLLTHKAPKREEEEA